MFISIFVLLIFLFIYIIYISTFIFKIIASNEKLQSNSSALSSEIYKLNFKINSLVLDNKNENSFLLFKSASDPKLIEFLHNLTSNANEEITFLGLGLGILVNNIELIENISNRVRQKETLLVTIIFGDGNNLGVQNRINEEESWHKRENSPYDRDWIEKYPREVNYQIHKDLTNEEKNRIIIKNANCSPMITIVKIDNNILFFMYGSPNIRGSKSPWVLLDSNNSLFTFLTDTIEYYKDESVS